MDKIIEGIVDRKVDGKKSRIPARLDFIQSATGLVLALFIKFHLLFVSSILLGKDAMKSVETFLAGGLFIEGGTPKLVVLSTVVIFTLIVIHAAMALRKFPNSYRQYRNFRSHTLMFPHDDTKLWNVQMITGFILFFLGAMHVYNMAVDAEWMGPFASADRIFSDNIWILYIFLLISVELHATIGLYRLVVKWGWFEGDDYRKSRQRYKKFRNAIIVFYLILGFMSLAAYMKIGYEHKDNYGERYHHSAAMMLQDKGILS